MAKLDVEFVVLCPSCVEPIFSYDKLPAFFTEYPKDGLSVLALDCGFPMGWVLENNQAGIPSPFGSYEDLVMGKASVSLVL